MLCSWMLSHKDLAQSIMLKVGSQSGVVTGRLVYSNTFVATPMAQGIGICTYVTKKPQAP